MKPFGTWGVVPSFQLGGIIGCLTGIATIVFVLNPIGVTALVGVGVAMLVGALAGWAISSYDAGTGALSNSITGQVVHTSTDFVKTTAGKIATGVAVVGLVTTATVASISPSKQVSPISTQTATPIVISSQLEPTATEVEPTTIVETLAPTQPSECAQLNLTPEECANLGYHNYTMTACSSSCECSSGGGVPVHIDNILRGTDNYETEHIGTNSYKQVFHNETYDSHVTINFTSTGFHLRIETISCTFEEDWTISE